MKGDVVTHKKSSIVEGRARAKFDFTAQTNLELPLKKGEIVVLTRRIDHNWWEGRRGSHTGIFPDSYVTILQEPTHNQSGIESDFFHQYFEIIKLFCDDVHDIRMFGCLSRILMERSSIIVIVKIYIFVTSGYRKG